MVFAGVQGPPLGAAPADTGCFHSSGSACATCTAAYSTQGACCFCPLQCPAKPCAGSHCHASLAYRAWGRVRQWLYRSLGGRFSFELYWHRDAHVTAPFLNFQEIWPPSRCLHAETCPVRSRYLACVTMEDSGVLQRGHAMAGIIDPDCDVAQICRDTAMRVQQITEDCCVLLLQLESVARSVSIRCPARLGGQHWSLSPHPGRSVPGACYS